MGVILIAFEREAELSALDQLLSGRGHKVVRSGNGLAALDAARREPPHAIVSDIVLPRMDGFALCRKWKQDERLQAIPFLFYTRRHDDPKYERFALELGAERFLARSVPPETLCTALDELLANAAKANGQNTGNTTPLPTLDETVIQRTVGLDKAQRAAEAEKVQRIAELESAQRKHGASWKTRSANSAPSWRTRSASMPRSWRARSASRPKRSTAPNRRTRACSARSKSSKRQTSGSLPAKRASAACSNRIRCRCGSRITRPAVSSQSTTRHSRCTVIAARSSSDSRAPRSKRPTPKTAPGRSRISARTAVNCRSRCARTRSNSTAALPISFRATT